MPSGTAFLGYPGGQELSVSSSSGYSMNSFIFVVLPHQELSLEHIPGSMGPSHEQQHPQKLKGQK